MDMRIIKNPSPGTVDILMRRSSGREEQMAHVGAIGLLQGKLIEMITAADIAEKAVGVTVRDIRGSCPQNMILLAIFGDTAAVESALSEISEKEENGSYVYRMKE